MKSKRSSPKLPFIFRPLMWGRRSKSSYPTPVEMFILVAVGGVGLVIFSIILIGASIFYASPLVRNSISTRAEIIEIEVLDDSSYCNRSLVTYEFDVEMESGETVFKGEGRTSDCVDMGDRITITYAANNPNRSMIGEPINKIEEAPAVLGGFAALVVLAAYLLCGGLAMRRLTSQVWFKNDMLKMKSE